MGSLPSSANAAQVGKLFVRQSNLAETPQVGRPGDSHPACSSGIGLSRFAGAITNPAKPRGMKPNSVVFITPSTSFTKVAIAKYFLELF